MPELSLVFNSTLINVDPQDATRISLTDMWRAHKGDRSERPVNWIASRQATDLADFLADQQKVRISDLLKTEPGRNGSTFAHWQLAMAYAKYLSPAFHAWCNEVVRAHMERPVPAPQGLTLDALGPLIATVVRETLLALRYSEALPATTHYVSEAQRQDLLNLARHVPGKTTPQVWQQVRHGHYRPCPKTFGTVPAADYGVVANRLKALIAAPPEPKQLPPTPERRFADPLKDRNIVKSLPDLQRFLKTTDKLDKSRLFDLLTTKGFKLLREEHVPPAKLGSEARTEIWAPPETWNAIEHLFAYSSEREHIRAFLTEPCLRQHNTLLKETVKKA